jgi:hypothetical protein
MSLSIQELKQRRQRRSASALVTDEDDSADELDTQKSGENGTAAVGDSKPAANAANDAAGSASPAANGAAAPATTPGVEAKSADANNADAADDQKQDGTPSADDNNNNADADDDNNNASSVTPLATPQRTDAPPDAEFNILHPLEVRHSHCIAVRATLAPPLVGCPPPASVASRSATRFWPPTATLSTLSHSLSGAFGSTSDR